MPTRAPVRCTQCKAIATHHGRCDDHQRKAWENPSANSQALTGRQRAMLRERELARHPYCGVCDEDTVRLLQLDHIVEVADGGALMDPDNLWLLCKTCHEIKTKAARAARNDKRRSRR